MIDETRQQTIRNHVRELRIHLLAILDWIEGELDTAEPPQETLPSPVETVPSPVGVDASDPLTDRHYWILTQLGQGVRLTRKHVMEQFGYSERHVKRILAVLRKRSLIRFQHVPRPGHYVLCDMNGSPKHPPGPVS